MKRKTLQDLTIRDNFMFGAVMLQTDNCKKLLEMILNIEIDQIIVETEKSIVYHPEYKGVRLDVYAMDSEHTRYNIELQIEKTATEKRSRYYHSHMDMDLLLTGLDYEELPNTYIIFICDYDPIGYGKYQYTQLHTYTEAPEYISQDGVHTIFLSTRGTNADEVSPELVNFLSYVREADLKAGKNYEDSFVTQIDESVESIKKDRGMEERFMVLEEMLRKERREGIEEGQNRMVTLVAKLTADGRLEELSQLSTDNNLLMQLFKEYNV